LLLCGGGALKKSKDGPVGLVGSPKYGGAYGGEVGLIGPKPTEKNPVVLKRYFYLNYKIKRTQGDRNFPFSVKCDALLVEPIPNSLNLQQSAHHNTEIRERSEEVFNFFICFDLKRVHLGFHTHDIRTYKTAGFPRLC